MSTSDKASDKSTRDPRFITLRRGGSLHEKAHRLLASWAADCAEHVLHLFEMDHPSDNRPRHAIKQTRAWVNGEISMTQAREAAFEAHAAARQSKGAATLAARAAGHAVATAHMADHELGAAAYAIKAVRECAVECDKNKAAQQECEWQRSKLPLDIKALVLSDQKNRNPKYWNLFT